MAAARMMILALVFCVTVVTPHKNVNRVVEHSVVLACNNAADPESCFSTVTGLSGWPHSVPSELVNVAVKASIGLVERTSATALGLSGAAVAGMERSALFDCIELLDDTVDELTEALTYVLGLDMNMAGFQLGDVRTFLSAALTNQETCIEGLSNTNGIVKPQLQSNVERISNLVSTSLAMAKRLSHISDAMDDFNSDLNSTNSPSHNRRLLSGNRFPAWLSAADRKLLQAAPPGNLQVDAVVAQDGTGNFPTITAAINAAPEKSSRRYVIRVKAGVYHENVEIKKKKTNITLIGDGMDSTVVTGNLSVMSGVTTFRSATFAVKGAAFIARDMGFENTAGPQNHQAVALRVDSDRSVFYRCSIKGYQDTLYAHSLRQFYRECHIYGTVDFIFGNGAAVFQSCLIMPRKPLQNQTITITAQSRKDPNQNTGFSIHDCNITSSADFIPVKMSVPTYLGRPWKQFSRTVVMQSYLDDIINPRGWQVWNASNFALDTLYYGEYMNYGPGAGLAGRVKWIGYHNINNTEANRFTVARLIEGNKWLPWTGVTYMSGLKV